MFPSEASCSIAMRRLALSDNCDFMVNKYTYLIGQKQGVFHECENYFFGCLELVGLIRLNAGCLPEGFLCEKK